jgi:hypothetical protein
VPLRQREGAPLQSATYLLRNLTRACPEEQHTKRVRSMQIDDISKVEAYFGRVQQANTEFTGKLLSYFDNVVDSARRCPRHLVMALRVVLNQEKVWATLQESGASNPWGLVYRVEVCKRMRGHVARQLKPICLEADRVRAMHACHARVPRPPRAADAHHCCRVQVFASWMQAHGRAAPLLFQEAAAQRGGGGSSPPGSFSGGSDNGARVSGGGAPYTSAPYTSAPYTSASAAGSAAAAAVMRGTSLVAARLIGGVGHVPIKLSSMAEPVSSTPEAVNWLHNIETDEHTIETMGMTLAHADEVRSGTCAPVTVTRVLCGALVHAAELRTATCRSTLPLAPAALSALPSSACGSATPVPSESESVASSGLQRARMHARCRLNRSACWCRRPSPAGECAGGNA